MRMRLWAYLLAFNLVFGASPGWGAELKSSNADNGTPYFEILKVVMNENPSLRAARQKWEAAQEETSAATTFPDPVFTYVAMKEELQTRAGPLEKKMSISQKIPIFGKRGYRRDMAQSQAAAAEEYVRAKMFDLGVRTARAYYDLYYLDHAIQINKELADQLRNLSRIAEQKYATGTQSQTAAFRAQVELASLLNELITLEQKRAVSLARLNSLMGRDPKTSVVPQPPMGTPLKINRDEFIAQALQSRPELQMARAQVGGARASAGLAGRSYWPDLTIGYERSFIGDGTTQMAFDGKDAEAFMFGVNVPIWFWKYDDSVSQGRLSEQAANAVVQDLENQTTYEVEAAIINLETEARQVELLNGTVIPQAEQSLKSSRRGYEADRVGFLELLDSVRMLLKFKLELKRHTADLEIAKAELERKVGEALFGQTTPEGKNESK